MLIFNITFLFFDFVLILFISAILLGIFCGNKNILIGILLNVCKSAVVTCQSAVVTCQLAVVTCQLAVVPSVGCRYMYFIVAFLAMKHDMQVRFSPCYLRVDSYTYYCYYFHYS